MSDYKKVIKGLECCKDINKLNCDDCAYTYNARSDRCECTAEMASDALILITAIQKIMKQLLIVPNWQSTKDTYMPVKNTTKDDCYKALWQIQEILGTRIAEKR